MIYQMYVIYDRIAGIYGTPFTSLNDATAVRQFRHQIASNLMAEPTDFELYECGSFDAHSGLVTALPQNRFIEKGVVSHD